MWFRVVPFAGKIAIGETVKIECVDWTGGQIGNNDSAEDMKVGAKSLLKSCCFDLHSHRA